MDNLEHNIHNAVWDIVDMKIDNQLQRHMREPIYDQVNG